MERRVRCVESGSHDPYGNLAVEECLLRSARPGERTLFLWQNERTVVVGRNQHASAECDVARLAADGGHLARRLSGGGAVFHDLGNLNFTFVATTDEYDQAEQTEVILSAVRSLGIEATRTGRNDLVTADGRKFSGHAYYHAEGASLHHGTIMVDVDKDALSRYLVASPEKLRPKGVQSVRSRVVNLRELKPDLTIPQFANALVEAFGTRLGTHVETEGLDGLDQGQVSEARERFSSVAWLFRGERAFGETHETRFGWGLARADLTVADDVIVDVSLFSDSLDTTCLDRVPTLLKGSALDGRAIEGRLVAGGVPLDMASDIARLILEERSSS